MKRALAVGTLTVTLAGCFPYVTSYVHLEGPGVKNAGACAGPLVFASYEAQGARFEVTLEPGRIASRSEAGYLRVRAPQGMVISMPDPIGYVSPEGQPSIRFELRPVEPPEQRYPPGFVKPQDVVQHMYGFVGLPPIASSGGLTLPVVYLNGIAVISPPLTFHRRPYAGVVPLNC